MTTFSTLPPPSPTYLTNFTPLLRTNFHGCHLFNILLVFDTKVAQNKALITRIKTLADKDPLTFLTFTASKSLALGRVTKLFT